MAPEWVPDSKGNLVAEKGDNAKTLSTFLNISEQAADLFIKTEKLKTTASGDVKEGQRLTLDNAFIKSIRMSTSDYTLDAALSGTSRTGPTPEDDYNCWGSAIAGTQKKDIKVGVGIATGEEFNNDLKSDYTPVQPSEAKFGETVLRFADGNNQTQHGAVFYGKSKDGTVYVYTKNGWQLKPEIMKLSTLQSKIPQYGDVKGVTNGTSGYYNPKK